MTMETPSDRLRSWAKGNRKLEAAVMLLVNHRTLAGLSDANLELVSDAIAHLVGFCGSELFAVGLLV